MGKADLRIDWATHEAAKYACENWHYSGCLPAGKMVKVGVWENKKFIGVVLFSCGASPPLFVWAERTLGLSKTGVCELTRIALASHVTPVSKIMKIALLFLRKSNPGLRAVVSFADLDEGHHGGIYQAGGWIYTGVSNAGGRQGYMIKGRKVHCRSVGALAGSNSLAGARKLDPNATEVRTLGKHKYLMPLDAEMRERILPLAKPYPKRAKQAMTDHQSAQRQGGTDPHAPNSGKAA
jgi:hypothetical protein